MRTVSGIVDGVMYSNMLTFAFLTLAGRSHLALGRGFGWRARSCCAFAATEFGFDDGPLIASVLRGLDSGDTCDFFPVGLRYVS